MLRQRRGLPAGRARRRGRTRTEPIEWFLLNAEAIVELDITSADALRRLVDELHEREVTFAMARVKQDLRKQLQRVGLLEAVGEDRIFPTLPVALEAFERRRRADGAGD